MLAIATPLERPDHRPGLVEAAKTGDMAAFELLMRQNERLVLVTALRLLGNLEDAQDASQEVFLRLYRSLGKLQGSASLGGWLYRVTVNACHDLRRRRPPAAPVEDAADLPAREPDPQQTMAEAERRRVLELSLRLLSEKERAALVLRDLEGLETREVARILGVQEVTVRSQIATARIKLKRMLEGSV